MAHEYDAENVRSAEELRAVATSLDDAQLATEVGGGWTVATAFAHLAFWDRRVAAFCALWQRGVTSYPSPPDDPADEATNQALEPLLHLVPPRDAVRLAIAAAEAANAALASLTSAQAALALAEDSPVVAHRSRHRREHIAQIRAAFTAAEAP